MAIATRKVKTDETRRKRQTRRVLPSKTNLRVGLMAIFKNESMGIREWIEHYKWQGMDRIFMINNDSNDDWQSIVKDYPDFVTAVVQLMTGIGLLGVAALVRAALIFSGTFSIFPAFCVKL
jgi:hypothetical protein